MFDKEAISLSTTGENSNPPNESSANIEQPGNIINILIILIIYFL